MPKRLKKLSEEVIHQNPWWIYKHDTYTLPNGNVGNYYYAELRGMSMVIPVLDDGRVVLTLQQRYLLDKQSIEFPGGGITQHQEPQQTAKEEVLEETGYVIDNCIKLATIEPANGYAKDTTHVFIASVIDKKEKQLEETEDIELLYRFPDEIDRMIIQGDIWDGQTIAAWFFARHHLHHSTP